MIPSLYTLWLLVPQLSSFAFEASKSTQSPTMGLTTQGTTGRPSGIYQFNRLKELLECALHSLTSFTLAM